MHRSTEYRRVLQRGDFFVVRRTYARSVPINEEPTRARVSLRTLLPYVRAHRATLLAVALLSLVASVVTLAQPLMTRRILDALKTHEPIATSVGMLIAVLAVVAAVTAIRDYLLQR